MIPSNVADLTDDQLVLLRDMLLAEQFRREFLADEVVASRLRGMSRDSLDDLILCADKEVDKRAENQEKLLVAHEMEQGEARVESGSRETRHQRLLRRTATLLSLLNRNAPDFVIQGMFKSLSKAMNEA